MGASLAQHWEAVLSADPDGGLQRRLLKATLLVVLGIEVPFAIATPLLDARPLPILGIHLAVIASCLGGLGLVRAGLVRLAGIAFVCVVWVLLTLSVVLLGGTRSPSFFTYFAVVFVAGFVWSVRAACWLGALSAASTIAVAVLEGRGLLPEPLVEVTAGRLVEAAVAQLVITVALLGFASRSVRSSLARARRKERSAAHAAEAAERRAVQLEAIARLGERAIATGDLQSLFDEAVRTVADTLRVEFCKVLELSPDGTALLLRAGVGWREGAIGTARVATGRESQAGFTLVSTRPVVVADFEAETRFDAPPLLREHGVRSGISVVIPTECGAFGVLGAHSHAARTFEANDVQFVQSVANLLAAAVSRTRLERQMAASVKLEALGRLAGGIAHDFNNVLTLVLGYADLLVEALDGDAKLRDDAAEIRDAARRAGSLTSELLAFAKGQPAQTEAVDLASLVERCARMLSRVVGEAVKIDFAAEIGLGPIQADPVQIERIVANLVLNARDAMPGGGQIAIRAANRDTENGPRVELAIRDTGRGMDVGVQARIFEPFFTTKPEGEGSGLGLPSVYGIVHQMGGDIHVTSSPGLGTDIVLQFPRAPQRSASEPLGPEIETTLDGRGLTVLLAEDDRSLRRLIRGVLAERGFEVLEASDGRAALALVRGSEARVDLILTDVVMPELGGIELAAAIRSLHPGVLAIFLSGYDRNGQLSELLERPENLFLAKPFRALDLLRAIGTALSSRRSAPLPPRSPRAPSPRAPSGSARA